MRRFLGLAAATCTLAVPTHALAAGPAGVTVRVEGTGDTLVPRSALRTTAAAVVKDGDPTHACTGTSAAGALELATAGRWAGTWTQFKLSVDAIGGEQHLFGSGQFWGFYVNEVPAQTGVCDAELQEGDQVLFAAQPETGTPGVLSLRGLPATAAPGGAVTVSVQRTVTTADPPTFTPTTVRVPAAGATVSGGGASGTTGADGTAQLTFAAPGPATVRATRAGDIRSAAEAVCVTDGAEGACGPAAAAAVLGQTCATTGDDGRCGTRDRRAPLGRISSIREGARFVRGKGPRVLRGTASADPSGLREVRLRLTRMDGGRCATFDGRSERFVAMARCGARRGRWFSAGDREDWSYLLPSRLTRGRYVLDLQVSDRAGNREAFLQRARTRVVFHVR